MPYGIQQPAISGQLGQLEKSLGVKLFHRRPFALTPAGQKLFTEIEHFFISLAELPHQVRGHGQRLRLAAPAIILRDYLPKILVEYKRRYSNFRVTLHDANQAVAEELLLKREIDLAITELETRPAPSINCCMLLRLPLALVVPKKAKYRRLADFFCNDVAKETLISLPVAEVLSKNFQTGLKSLGLKWSPGIEVTSLELVDLYAKLGFGIGLSIVVPQLQRRSGLKILPLRQFPLLTIAALWSGDLSETAAAFLADVKKLAGRVSHQRAQLSISV